MGAVFLILLCFERYSLDVHASVNGIRELKPWEYSFLAVLSICPFAANATVAPVGVQMLWHSCGCYVCVCVRCPCGISPWLAVVPVAVLLISSGWWGGVSPAMLTHDPYLLRSPGGASPAAGVRAGQMQ